MPAAMNSRRVRVWLEPKALRLDPTGTPKTFEKEAVVFGLRGQSNSWDLMLVILVSGLHINLNQLEDGASTP